MPWGTARTVRPTSRWSTSSRRTFPGPPRPAGSAERGRRGRTAIHRGGPPPAGRIWRSRASASDPGSEQVRSGLRGRPRGRRARRAPGGNPEVILTRPAANQPLAKPMRSCSRGHSLGRRSHAILGHLRSPVATAPGRRPAARCDSPRRGGAGLDPWTGAERCEMSGSVIGMKTFGASRRSRSFSGSSGSSRTASWLPQRNSWGGRKLRSAGRH